eukprot:753705-Hanusia_phi.AAC.5
MGYVKLVESNPSRAGVKFVTLLQKSAHTVHEAELPASCDHLPEEAEHNNHYVAKSADYLVEEMGEALPNGKEKNDLGIRKQEIVTDLNVDLELSNDASSCANHTIPCNRLQHMENGDQVTISRSDLSLLNSMLRESAMTIDRLKGLYHEQACLKCAVTDVCHQHIELDRYFSHSLQYTLREDSVTECDGDACTHRAPVRLILRKRAIEQLPLTSFLGFLAAGRSSSIIK